jgi:putative SOS response-associated peptidase YedK
MCGRYSSSSSSKELAKIFDIDEVRAPDLPPRYNVAPSLPVYAVALSRTEGDSGRKKAAHRVLGTFQWGLVPSWAKDPKIGNRMINARTETVATKPAYRRAFAGHRTSLLPADSFFEWQRHPAKAGKSGSKLPYAIHRADGQPMAFAALWEVWRDKANPDAEPLRTCVIITTAANDLMKPIHDRMPVILDPADWDTWLDLGTDLDTLQRLLVPTPAGDLEAYPVSTQVNNVRNDSPELLDPLPSPPAPQPAGRPAKTAEQVKTKSGGR